MEWKTILSTILLLTSVGFNTYIFSSIDIYLNYEKVESINKEADVMIKQGRFQFIPLITASVVFGVVAILILFVRNRSVDYVLSILLVTMTALLIATSVYTRGGFDLLTPGNMYEQLAKQYPEYKYNIIFLGYVPVAAVVGTVVSAVSAYLISTRGLRR